MNKYKNTVLETHDFCLYDRRSTLSIRIFSKILKAQELLVPPSWVLCDFVDSFARMPATVGKSEKNVGVPFFFTSNTEWPRDAVPFQ